MAAWPEHHALLSSKKQDFRWYFAEEANVSNELALKELVFENVGGLHPSRP